MCYGSEMGLNSHTGHQGVKYLMSAILAWRRWNPPPLSLLHSEKMETSLNMNRACPPYLYFDSAFKGNTLF